MRKKLLAAFLALAMALALLPGTVFAQAEDAPAAEDVPAAAADERTAMIAPTISYADGKVTITRSELLPAEAKIYYAVGENRYQNADVEESLYTAPF